MVRTGIAMYGLAPANDDPFKDDLRPAMKLSSYVAGVRVVEPGDSVGYGRRFVADAPARIGIVPIGYADGICRRLTNARRRARRRAALPHHRHDQHGPAHGAAARRLGRRRRRGRVLRRRRRRGRGGRVPAAAAPRADGTPRILCEEVARLLETINYEVVCDVAPRVVRRYRGAGPAA